MRVTLSGRRITFDPPQHLAMIDIKRQSDGLSFKILHESGHETDDVALEHSVTVPPSLSGWAESAFREGLRTQHARAKDVKFPLIAEINIQDLPSQYRAIPTLSADFVFIRGEVFSVFVIGQEVLNTTVRAD